MRFGDNLGSALGAKMQAYVDKQLLQNISQNAIFDRFCTMQRALPTNSGKEIVFKKWVRMSDLYFTDNLNRTITGNALDVAGNNVEENMILVPKGEYNNFILPEGDSGTSKGNMKLVETKTSVFPIGDWIPYTEELKTFHDKWTLSETARQMGELAGLIVDGFYRDLYTNGAGHVIDISGNGSGSNNVVDNAFTEALRKLTVLLKLSGAQPVNQIVTSSPNFGTVPVRARYTAIVHTIVAERLRDNPDFVPEEKYEGKKAENEVGIIGNVRIVEDENAYIEATNNPGEYKADVIVFGRDHSLNVPLRGKRRAEFIFQPIGSAGTADPLRRKGTAGWKSWLGAKVVYPERLGLVQALVNFS